MGSGDQIRIRRPHSLQTKQQVGELVDSDNHAAIGMPFADLAILTECAMQGTTSEEYRSRTIRPNQRRLLSTMQTHPGDSHFGSFPAYPTLPPNPIDSTRMGT